MLILFKHSWREIEYLNFWQGLLDQVWAQVLGKKPVTILNEVFAMSTILKGCLRRQAVGRRLVQAKISLVRWGACLSLCLLLFCFRSKKIYK